MRLPFDVYRQETSGNLRWMDGAKTLEEAQSLVQGLPMSSQGGYLIYNYRTGLKMFIKPENEALSGAAASVSAAASVASVAPAVSVGA